MANSNVDNFIHADFALSTVVIAYLCSQLTDQVFTELQRELRSTRRTSVLTNPVDNLLFIMCAGAFM
jgi:uncharacterized PurR-regulated membrane protein YhhQ (DUF165 family)